MAIKYFVLTKINVHLYLVLRDRLPDVPHHEAQLLPVNIAISVLGHIDPWRWYQTGLGHGSGCSEQSRIRIRKT